MNKNFYFSNFSKNFATGHWIYFRLLNTHIFFRAPGTLCFYRKCAHFPGYFLSFSLIFLWELRIQKTCVREMMIQMRAEKKCMEMYIRVFLVTFLGWIENVRKDKIVVLFRKNKFESCKFIILELFLGKNGE